MFNKYTILSIILLFPSISFGMQREILVIPKDEIVPLSGGTISMSKEEMDEYYFREMKRITGSRLFRQTHSQIFTREVQKAMDEGGTSLDLFRLYIDGGYAYRELDELRVHAEATQNIPALSLLREKLGVRPEIYFAYYLSQVRIPLISYCIQLKVHDLTQPIQSPWSAIKKTAIDWIHDSDWYRTGFVSETAYNEQKQKALVIIQKATAEQQMTKAQKLVKEVFADTNAK